MASLRPILMRIDRNVSDDYCLYLCHLNDEVWLQEEQERSRGLRQEKEFDRDSNTSSAKKYVVWLVDVKWWLVVVTCCVSPVTSAARFLTRMFPFAQ